jgi:superfamily II DNA or RNA helicase
MTLAQLLEDRFRGDIRFRGAEFLKNERVTIGEARADRIVGVVRDGAEFESELIRENDSLRMRCTCPQGGGRQPACKHLWGLILAVDAGGLVSQAAKPGHVPPFVVESTASDFDDDIWEDDNRRDVYEPPGLPNPALRPAMLAEPQLRSWDAQLQALRGRLQQQSRRGRASSRERSIFYEIDVTRSSEQQRLVIETTQRQRRSNGQWGKLKPLKVRSARLEDLELDEDRRLLAYMLGGAPERANWFTPQSDVQLGANRYQLSFELADLMLARLCATERLRFREPDSDAAAAKPFTPLQWDPGSPWELCLEVVSHDESNTWRLQGRLRRGDESLDIRDPVLLIPGGFVFTRTHVARLQDFGAFDWIPLLRSDRPITIDRGEEHELVDRLLDMPQLPRLDLPPELRLEELASTPTPLLFLQAPRGVRWQQDRLLAEVQFEYAGTRIRATSPQAMLVQREWGRCVPRDRAAEARAWDELQQCGFRQLNPDQQPSGRINRYDVEIPIRWLGPAVRQLVKLGWRVHADGQQVRQPGQMQFDVKSGIDWFELHAKVDFDGRTIPFPTLLAALARGDSTVRLDDGSFGILPEEWAQQFGLLSGLGVAEGDHVRFTQSQAMLLDVLLASQESVQFDEGFAHLRDRLRSFDGIRPASEPEGFHGELRPYQREGLGWLEFLKSFQLGGCLADDMGLGKTIQLLALLQNRKLERGPNDEHRPSLVVVPKSLIFNWHQECTRFTPQLKVIDYTGLHRAKLAKRFAKADIILTTYGTLRRDIVQLREIPFDFVVLDEAQTIKNAGSQVAKAARLLNANHRLALSGTPIENRLSDLWSIFEFLNPGMLGRAAVFKVHTSDGGDAESRRMLSQALRPFILRRTKGQVAAELPERLEQTVLCNMGKQQETLYTELRDHYRQSLLGLVKKQGLARSKIHVLEALLRLRQAACHPGLLDENRIDEPSAKLDALCLHLQDVLAEGHKALVFSQFTSMLTIVRRHLEQRGIVFEYLDGQTRNRREPIERFQTDPTCGVFLISLKAGGLGLNLTAADYVFLLDPWWNPAVEAQAIDRAHRIGQTRQVFAYRLICHNTVEEKIAELQTKKKELAEAILQADNNLIGDLSAEDLELLLS